MISRCCHIQIAALALFGALAGCTAGPDYASPEPPSSAAIRSGAFLRAGETVAAAPAARWWEALGDPQLSGLIEKGLRQAPGIAAAEARLRQARAGLAASRAALLPMLGNSAIYTYADLPDQAFGGGSDKNELFVLGFDARWEADLWGTKRRAVERSRAEAGAARARLADAQVSLSAEIARNYIGLRAREASLVQLDQRRDLERQITAIAAQRLKGGTGTKQSLAAAHLQLDQTEAEHAAVGADIAMLRDALAVLTGEAPGSLDSLPPSAIPLPPARVEIGEPAAMLARRPDVIVAERRLAAATAQIGIEKARRFPDLSLLGLIGIGGSEFGNVFDWSQLSTIAVPRLTWNFLDFGRTDAAVHGAEASRDASLADYQASVLAALQDAEASLARFGAARIAYGRAGQSSVQAREISRLQEMRARAGTASQTEALEAGRQSVNAQLAEANSRAALTLAYITLAKSLGLGWETDLTP